MTVFIFPGQGSQKKGMGGSLFDEVKEFLDVEAQVDALLGYSLRRLCLDDPDNQLKQTQFTQPCLYVVNALHYYMAVAAGSRADYLAGHSLGEYNALLAAGAFDLLTGLKLVKRRGELMAQAKNGGMAAVLGLDASAVERVLQNNGLVAIDVANFNSPSQTVVSGPADDIKRAAPFFEKAGAKLYMPLAVSAAFHSRYVSEAAQAYNTFLQGFSFNPLRTPVIANVTGQPYPDGDPSAVVRSLLVQQITQAVQWTKSVRFLLSQGQTQFMEMGPGNVLTRLVQDIQKSP
jgi:malonyl CoA-acyl carrier protein transacylase